MLYDISPSLLDLFHHLFIHACCCNMQNGLSVLKIKMSCIFLSKNSWLHWIFSSSALLFHIMSTSSMGLYLQKPCAPWARDASFQVVLHLIMLNVSLTFRIICIWGAFTPFSSCMWSWVRLQPGDCSLPGSSVHGILRTRALKWVVMPFFRESPKPGIQAESLISRVLAGGFFTTSATWEALYTM